MCVDDSMCMYHPPCVTCGRNVNSPACKCKVQRSNPQRYFPKRQCAFRNCKQCGVAHVNGVIEKENVDALSKTNIIIKWKQWLWESRKGKNGEITRALNLCTIQGTQHEILDDYMDQLNDISAHLFHASWNYYQFVKGKEQLKTGEVLLVHDFP